MDIGYHGAITAPHPLAHIQLAANARYLALPYGQGKAAVFARDDPRAPLIELGKAHANQVTKCAFGHSDAPSTSLCTVSSDSAVVWRVEDALRDAAAQRRPVAQQLDWDSTQSGPCECIFFSPDDALVGICAGFDVLVLDAASGNVHSRLEGHTATVTAAAFTPQRRGSVVVSASEDRTFKVWDITEGALVYQSTIVSSSPFIAIAMDPCAARFALGSEDGVVRFYDAAAGGSYRCLHAFDVGRAIRENRAALAERAAAAQKRTGPQVISSRRPQADAFAPSERVDEDDQDGGVHTSPAVLGMHYVRPATVPSSGTRAAVGDGSLLLVGTAGALAYVDTRSYDAVAVHDFAETPLSGPKGREGARPVSYTLPVAGAFSFADVPQPAGSVVCALGCAFERSVCVLSVAPPERVAVAPYDMPLRELLARIAEKCRWPDAVVTDCARALREAGCATAGDLASLSQDEWHAVPVPSLVRGMLWERVPHKAGAGAVAPESGVGAPTAVALSVVPETPLAESSPLRSTMAPKSTSADAKGAVAKPAPTGTKKAGAGSGIGPSGSSGAKGSGAKAPAVVDKPLTFHAKVKSSGYGAAPPPRKLFAGVKARPVPASSKAKGATGANALPAPRDRPVDRRSSSAPSLPAPRKYPRDTRAPVEPDARLPAQGLALHPVAINRLAFSADGKLLASAGCDRNACVLRLPMASNNCTSYRGHNGPVGTVHFSADSELLLTASSDATARLWSVGKTEPLLVFSHARRSFKEGEADKPNPLFAGEVRQARFYYMDRFVLLASGGSLFMYKYHIDEERVDDVRRYKTNNQYKLVKEFALSQAQGVNDFGCVNGFHSYTVVCAGSDRSLEIFDMNVGKSAATIPDAHSRSIHAVRLLDATPHSSHSPTDHDLFATAAAGDALKLWDIRTQKCVRRFEGHSNRAMPVGLAFSPCGRFIATGSEDRSAYLYDIGAGTYIHKVSGHTDTVVDVAFHPVVPMLVTATLDGRVRAFVEPT